MNAISRIILTREEKRNRRWAKRLQADERPYAMLPLLRFTALPAPESRDFSAFDWIMFTSPQGVKAFAALNPLLGDARCVALGQATADAIREAGWQNDLDALSVDGAELARKFVSAAGAPGKVLLPGPKRRLTDPRASLEAAGYTVRELPLYETVGADPTAIAAMDLRPDDVIFFCSPSAVRAFAGSRDDKPQCVAIGATTADACRAAGFSPAVADTPDLNAMMRAAGLADLPAPTTEPVNPEMES